MIHPVETSLPEIFRNKAHPCGTLGALSSRLNSAHNLVSDQSIRYQEAASRIRDVDIADEGAKVARLSILQQTGASLLAQANTQPTLALQLLRNS